MELEWLQGDVDLDDMRMHYTRTGGDKPVLVLAHGFSDSGLCWLPVAQALSADYDVILPDARGHGLSSPVTPGQLTDRSADLAAFIRALKLDRPVVGGHSMGGITVSAMAARDPELARAVILEDPAWFDRRTEDTNPPSGDPEDNPWLRQLRGFASMSIEAVMDACRQASPQWGEVELRPWAESKKQFDLNCFRERDRNFNINWRDFARGIRVPALLVTGDTDKGGIIGVEMAAEAVSLNASIQVAHIAGAGHNIRRDNYPAYMAAVGAFLRSL